MLQSQQAQQYHLRIQFRKNHHHPTLEKKVPHSTFLQVSYIHGNRVVVVLKQLLRVGGVWVVTFRVLRVVYSISVSFNSRDCHEDEWRETFAIQG